MYSHLGNAWLCILYMFVGTDASEVKCYQISACGEDLMIGSMSNNATLWSLEGSVEECCLQQPFQERSYQLTEQGTVCHECIGTFNAH